VRAGFVLSSAHLKATHPLFSSRQLTYQVRSRPRHGTLEHVRSGRPVRRKFTQRDVDQRNIAYVLGHDTARRHNTRGGSGGGGGQQRTDAATNDSVTLRVVDLNRNYVDDIRYILTIAGLVFNHRSINRAFLEWSK